MSSQTRLIMGMPITVDIVDGDRADVVNDVFAMFEAVDRRFSLWKPDSEICAVNRGEIAMDEASAELREVVALAERTRRETDGYFDMRRPDGTIDPSGIVKGWAVRNAARLIAKAGPRDYFVDAGGDIQSSGHNRNGKAWTVGIRNPFNEHQIIKAVRPNGRGIATSGNYVRGDHIYNPLRPGEKVTGIVSLTVIGPDVLEADRFATAAFAMGRAGINFIESQDGLEGYLVDERAIATQTTGFGEFVTQ
jgi:FAD:protein FMN transferase